MRGADSSKEMKAVRGAVTCPRSQSKSVTDLQQTDLRPDFLTLLSKRKLGKGEPTGAEVCPSAAESQEPVQLVRTTPPSLPTDYDNRVSIQEPEPGQEPGRAPLREEDRRSLSFLLQSVPSMFLCLHFPVSSYVSP